MPKKNKRQTIDLGQVIGATIFISLLIFLILLGVFHDSGNQFTSNFFEDVSNAMQWK